MQVNWDGMSVKNQFGVSTEADLPLLSFSEKAATAVNPTKIREAGFTPTKVSQQTAEWWFHTCRISIEPW